MAKGTLYTFGANENVAWLDFNDGSRAMVEFDQLSSDMAHKLMAHGWKQKVVDAAAKSRDPETGRSAADWEKIEAMKAVAGRILAGVWATVGGGGGVTSEKMFLIRALAEFSGKSMEEAKAFVEGKTKAQQTALAQNAKIKSIIERMRAATIQGVDSDELLDGFLDD